MLLWWSRLSVVAKTMTIAARYVVSRTGRQGLVALEEIAKNKTVLCPSMELPAITPIFWEEHLARIRGAATRSAEQVIAGDFYKRTFVVRGTSVYHVDEAVVMSGCLFLGHYRRDDLRNKLKKMSRIVIPRGPVREFRNVSFASMQCATTWFGHWLEDEVPYLMLASHFAPAIGIDRAPYHHEPDYLRLFDLKEPIRAGTAYCRDMTYVDEPALQSPIKAKRCLVLRSKLATPHGQNSRVFLVRGSSGARRNLVNELEVAERFAREGYAIVKPWECSLEKLLHVLGGAELVVSVEGSHLAHALYLMKDWGRLVIINPPHQVHTTVADVGVFLGLRGGMFVGVPVGESTTDFTVDSDELLRFTDFVDKVARREEHRLIRFREDLFRLALGCAGDRWG